MLNQSVQWYIFVGVLLVSVAASGALLKSKWLASVHLLLLGGIAAGPLGLGIINLDFVKDAKLLEVASEIAVIVSLYSAGVKMRVSLSSTRWITPLILASVTMLLTVALTAMLGSWLFSLSLPGAILLGAVLAPTDPVLADKVQVEHPQDDDRLRQSLTGEAGLNDGTAFPFVLLAVGLCDPQLHELGPGFATWFMVDLVWKVLGGLSFGAAAGYTLGKLILWVRSKSGKEEGSEELLTIGLIAIVYGVALFINTYAFLAVFAAAVSLRRIEFLGLKEPQNADTQNAENLHKPANDAQDDAQEEQSDAAFLREQTSVGSALEKISQVFLVVIVGVLLTTEAFLDWQLWAFALAMLFVVRPLAVLATLHTSTVNRTQKYLIAWFGVRGIGTIYYLAHAISLGVDQVIGSEVSILIGCCLATIMLSIFLHGTSDTPLMRWYASRPES